MSSLSGTRLQHAKLVAGRVSVKSPRKVAPIRIELAASELGDVRRDFVRIISRLKTDIEM